MLLTQLLTDGGKIGNDKMTLWTFWSTEFAKGAALPRLASVCVLQRGIGTHASALHDRLSKNSRPDSVRGL